MVTCVRMFVVRLKVLIRLHPSISSMNRVPPPLRGKTGAGVLPNTRLTPNWGQRVGLGNRPNQAQETYDL